MNDTTMTKVLVSQYKASLGMLRQTIEKTPPAFWNTGEYANPTWQIAYHVIWGVNFYLGADPESYEPFPDAIEGAESLGGAQEWENPEEGVVVEGFHTREQLLSYLDFLIDELPNRVEALPLEAPSGFEWYSYSRFELHINNIRHIQHHTAQIIERLKAKGLSGFAWWMDGQPPEAW